MADDKDAQTPSDDIPEMDPKKAKPSNPKGRKENLAQYNGKQHTFTREEMSKGGKVCQQRKKEQRLFSDIIQQFLDMKLRPGACMDLESYEGILEITRDQNVQVVDAIVLAQIKKAIKGDAKAFCLIRDMVGQQPTQKLEVTSNIPVFINDMPIDDDFETTQIFSGKPKEEPPKKKRAPRKKAEPKDQSE